MSATCETCRDLVADLEFAVKLLRPWAGGTAQIARMEATIAKAREHHPVTERAGA